jgi:hypothetical protein
VPWADRIASSIRALLSVSTYQPNHGYGQELDDPIVEQIREALGGNLQPLPTTRLRWYLKDLETAQAAADAGNLRTIGQLHRAMRRDGFCGGLVRTRTMGLLRLPRRFYGDEAIASELRAKNGSRSVFDEMFPPSELALLDWDGVDLGYGIAELLPVEGRDYPVMCRLDPEFLQFRWSENLWYYESIAGLLPITPGDGRWILHTPGGRLQPWNGGIWAANGRSFVNKEHAMLHRSNFSSKLANPARVGYAPNGATEEGRLDFIRKLMAWGKNTVFALPAGWEVKLLELTGGKTFEVFQSEIDTSNQEFMVNICGQEVTTTGGSGFANAEVPERVSQDLIQGDGDALAYTINTQGIPAYIAARYGYEAITTRATTVDWNTSKPKDLTRMASAMTGAGNAIKMLDEALEPHDLQVDVRQVVEQFAVPTLARDPVQPSGDVEDDPGILDDKRPTAALREAA